MNKIFKIIFAAGFLVLSINNNAIPQEVLTWQDCIQEAMKNHPDLISAEESVKQSEASKDITASSLLPQIGASASASKAKTTAGDTSNTANSFSYGVSGTQLLFDGKKTINKVNSAIEDIKAAQYSYKFTSSDVRLRLRTAFVNVLNSQELLNITKNIRDIRKSNYDLIELRYESGMEHKGALLTADANLAQADLEIKQAQRGLEVAQRELIKEMGWEQFSPVKVKGDFELKDLDLKKPDFEALAQQHPSLGRLKALKNAASFDIKGAKAGFLPTISAQAGAGKNGSSFLPQDDRLSVGLSLSIPVFEGGLKTAELAKARSVYAQAVADERSKKDGIVLGLEQAWVSFLNAVDNVEVQKKFLYATEERSKIAEAQYSLGLIQFDNWTIIEDDLVRAKKSLLTAQESALLAQANWIKAKGDTLENAN